MAEQLVIETHRADIATSEIRRRRTPSVTAIFVLRRADSVNLADQRRATFRRVDGSKIKNGIDADLRSSTNITGDRSSCGRKPESKGRPLLIEYSYRGRPKGAWYNQAFIDVQA